MAAVTDLSPKVVSVARAIDRLAPGEYSLKIVKPESKNESWQIEIDEIKRVQSMTVPSAKMVMVADLSKDDYRFAYIHKVNPCGGVAFYSKRRFIIGDIISVSNIVFENGVHPIVGDDIKCGHCGRVFSLYELNEDTFEVKS